jgi:hypothetical protein
MNEKIINHIEKISFQIRDFLRTNHRFDDLIFVNIKSFVSDIIKNKNTSVTSKSARKIRSSKSSNVITWSQIWVIDRNEFKKAIVSFEKIVELFFSFSKDHSKESFKNFINFAIESFVSSKLILSESFSSLTRTSINIANQIVNARDSSSLTSVSSDFENSANVRSFSKFDFTSRSYETSQKTNPVFVISKKNSKTSSFESIKKNSVLDFIENSKSSSIAQTSTRKTVNSARSISILQFVLHQKSASSVQSARIALNSNSTFSSQFSSRSITSESDKQTMRTSANYEISRNTFAVESNSASNMSQEFIETQRRELMIMMQKFWIQRSAFIAFSAASSTAQASDLRSERWVTADLEFFDSIYDEKFTVTTDSMQHVDKDTYFRDVYLFIDRIKNIAIIKEIETVRNNLYTCLRDTVMIWYTAELFEKAKELVRTKNNLDVWKRYLIKRFRNRSNVIMIIIIRERYTMNDARRRRESREYVSVIMRIARSIELESKSHQVMMIYNDLNLIFQRNISMSTLTTQIQNFLQHVDDKKDIWWSLISRNRNYTTQIIKSWVNYSFKSNAFYQSMFQNQFSIYYQSKFDQYDSQYSKQRNSEYFQRDQLFYQYDANQFYQSQSQSFSSAKQLKSSKSRLQIIDSEQ